MKKLTLLMTSLLLTAVTGFTQIPYTVTTQTQTYTALTGATSINGSTQWDDESYKLTLPFSFKLGTTTVSSLSLLLGFGGIGTDTTGIISGITYGDMDLADRGSITPSGPSLSPVRYAVTGATPNRIAKVEIANAGFFDEIDNNGTANDFVNIQVWVYETSNIIELHYGPSSISTSDYFLFSNGPAPGYVKNLDFNGLSVEKYYSLAGDPTAPTIDSIDIFGGSGSGLDSYPGNGTVYRFTPKSATGVSNIPGFASVRVYPTITNGLLNMELNEATTANYQVLAMDGRSTEFAGKLSKGNNRLDAGSLTPGMYLLRIENGTNRSIYRFLKN